MERNSSQDSSTDNKSIRQLVTKASQYSEFVMKFKITQITSESVIQKTNFYRILFFQVHLTGIIHVIMLPLRLSVSGKRDK